MATSKVWNGSSWVSGVLKVWDGSSWVAKPKYWDGSQWVDLFSSGAILTLNGLASSRSGAGSVTSGVRVNTDGTVQEINFAGSWVSQNPGVEWIDDGGATASDYEVMLVKSSGFTPSGPTLSTYHDITAVRQWTLTSTSGLRTFAGTMTIREKANTANSVSASVSMLSDSGFA